MGLTITFAAVEEIRQKILSQDITVYKLFPELENADDMEIIKSNPPSYKKIDFLFKRAVPRFKKILTDEFIIEYLVPFIRRKKEINKQAIKKMVVDLIEQLRDQDLHYYTNALKTSKRNLALNEFIEFNTNKLNSKLITTKQAQKMLGYKTLKPIRRLFGLGKIRGVLFKTEIWFYALKDVKKILRNKKK